MDNEPRVLDRSGLDALLAAAAGGHEMIGPTLLDGAIRYGPIESVVDLPEGWSDTQAAGEYRVVHRPGSQTLFDYAVGPDSLKPLFHPPRSTLFRAQREDGRISFSTDDHDGRRRAIVGVRPCELAAVAIQDTVLANGQYADRSYVERRADQTIIAVDCGAPAATCFCTSMGTGPRASTGFDIALTEIETSDGPRYVCRSGTTTGERLLNEIDAPPAAPQQVEEAERIMAAAADSMPIRLDPEQTRDDLATGLQADVWTEIELRCLACGNCTLVCPTCFCSTATDSTDLSDGSWTRTREWDSCFNLDFSAIHGHPVRESIGSRYRQWLTHKLSTWYQQFGTSGCVGCGRCVTWCPVGIDLVEEATKLSVGASS